MSLDKEKNIRFTRGAKPGRRGSGLLKILGTILLIFVMTGLIFTCIFAIYVKTNLSKEFSIDMKAFTLNLSSKIFYKDRSTGEYKELSSLYSGENRVWVDYKDMPIYLEKAAVSIEDKRFYKHHGVDWYRTGGAVVNMFFNMKDTFGGSTLTQQLIKNLTQEDQVTVKRKLLEIFRALEFEKKYSKEEIAEMYLNTVFLGESCYGVGSAAQVYFGKNVNELTVAECACLIGITNNPSAYDPYISDKNVLRNKTRQELILKEMYGQGYITKQQYDEAVAQKLEFKQGASGGTNEAGVNSWYVDAVIEDVIKDLQKQKGLSYGSAETLIFSAGYNIYCTIDPTVQEAMDSVYSDRANLPSGYSKSRTQDLQSAMVIIEPSTGDIVAMAGGMGPKTASRIYNRAYDMKRPPGSTIKPLSVYSAAIELGYIMPYTSFNDGANLKLSGVNWYPNNDDYENRGIVTVRQAVTKSINTVAAQIIDLISPSKAYNFLQEKYGISTLVSGADDSYAPMALGQLTNGATLIEMASAYTAFANEGVYTRGRLYTTVTDADGNKVLEKELDKRASLSKLTAYYMTDMMTNVVNNGTGVLAKLSNMPTAGKTGAAGDWLDRWFLGFTPYYVGAVWSGYDSPEYMGTSNPSSVLWKAVMSKVHADLEYKSFSMPSGLRACNICIDTGLLATEACAHDIRGDHTLTVYLPPEKIPSSYCTVHVMATVCSESHELFTDNCPAKDALKVGVLDLSKVPQGMKILTPDYINPDGKKIQYILTNMFSCTLHNTVVDPGTGWKLDGNTGYFIIPGSGFLYDPKTGKIYDPISKWEIDRATGALIDPKTGTLIDPYTGKKYDGTKKNPVVLPSSIPSSSTIPTTVPTVTPSPSPSSSTSPTSSPKPTTTPTPSRRQ